MEKGSVVAVTGASGYIGSYVCEALVKHGFKVRAVVRDPSNEEKIAHLRLLGPLVSFHRGNLLEEGSYDEAFRGADGVIHCAAVVEVGRVKNPMKEIVAPSVEGVENVLKSVSKCSSVKCFIHTSSMAAVHQRNRMGNVLSETDWNCWSSIENDPYGFAKTKAEELVWNFAKHNSSIRVRILNPVIVLGPVMNKAHTKSSTFFLRQAIFNNAVQPVFGCFVDVRDVAEAHVQALILVKDADVVHRFILSCDSPSMRASDLGKIAQIELPQYELKTPALYSPLFAWLLVLLSMLPFIGRFILNELERSALTWREKINNRKAKSILGIRFRPLNETVKDGVESIIQGGYAAPKPRR